MSHSLVLPENTERQETLEIGAIPEKIFRCVETTLAKDRTWSNPY